MDTKGSTPGFFGTAAGWVFCAFAVIALLLLVLEHRAHLGFIVPYLPLALVGVCVVLHGYMHAYGHRGRGDSDRRDKHHHH